MAQGLTASENAAAYDRCRKCTAVMLLLGAVPLVLIGLAVTQGFTPTLAESLRATAEADARSRLDEADLKTLTFRIDGSAGIVAGTPPAGMGASDAFARSRQTLAPMVGMPGIVARLENNIAERSAASAKR